MLTRLFQLRIGTRLALGFALILALSIVATTLALVNARNTVTSLRTMMAAPMATERLTSDMNTLIMSGIWRTAMVARSSDTQLGVTFAADIADGARQGGETMKKIEASLNTEPEKALFKALTDARNKYQKAKGAVIDAKKAGQVEDAERLYKDVFQPATDAYRARVNDLLALERKIMDDSANRIEEANAADTRLCVILCVLLTALGGVAAWLIARSITRPLATAIKVAQTVASGDLTTTFTAPAHDEVGDLMRALQDMNGSLADLVGEVQAGTHAIAGASAQIATGNLDLSSRTEQQAGSLEETASSMEELTTTVRHNADNAGQANQLVQAASGVAGRGGEIVGKVVDTMGSIEASPDRRHHLRHRRYRVPDQHPRAQRGGGSGARRRTGSRLCCRGLGGAQPRPAFGRCGERDQGTDRQFGRQGQPRYGAGAAGRRNDHRGGGQCRPRDRHHGRDHRRQPRAKRGHRPGQRSHQPDGPLDPGERGTG
jgi:methyl-accepting chemotaxis protein